MKCKRDRCAYCRRELEASTLPSRVAATRDHVVPRAAGGRRTVPCCRQCNKLKGSMMPWEWAAFMERHPRWWTIPKYRHSNSIVPLPRTPARVRWMKARAAASRALGGANG